MRSMKIFLLVFTVIFAENFLYGVTVKYNTPIMFKSKKFHDKNLWVHASSRDINNNATLDVGDATRGRSASRPAYVAEPDNHHEILIGTASASDTRDMSGNQIFVVQSVDDSKKTGDVLYGDKVKILSFFSGAGITSEAGLQERSRVLWVNYPARHYPNYCEIVVSVPEFSEAQTQKAHFTFVGVTKNTGMPVDDGDILYIKSLSGDKFSDGVSLWAFEASRWGTGFADILLNRGDEREMENGKFEIRTIQKESLISEGKVAYDRTISALKRIVVAPASSSVVQQDKSSAQIEKPVEKAMTLLKTDEVKKVQEPVLAAAPVKEVVEVKKSETPALPAIDGELKARWDKYYSDSKKLDTDMATFEQDVKNFAKQQNLSPVQIEDLEKTIGFVQFKQEQEAQEEAEGNDVQVKKEPVLVNKPEIKSTDVNPIAPVLKEENVQAQPKQTVKIKEPAKIVGTKTPVVSAPKTVKKETKKKKPVAQPRVMFRNM